MFNIFTFTKDVTNMTKLDRELRANASFGSLYSHANVKGNQIEIHFSSNLIQTQIDALSSVISAFSNVSVYDTLYSHLKSNTNLNPFVTETRLTSWKDKILAKLA